MINLKDTEKQLDFFGHKTFWFHVFKPQINGVEQKGELYSEFCDKKRILELVKIYNGQGIVCAAINEREKNKTKGEHVKHIGVFLFDVDVKKKLREGYASSKEHHEHAIKKAYEIKEWLIKQGYEVGLIIDSGNGSQIFVKSSIDISEENKRSEFLEKINSLEKIMRNKFNDDIVDIDFITKDINRRVKLAGTINKKDIHQVEDRLAKILEINMNTNVQKNNETFNSIKKIVKEDKKTKIKEIKLDDEELKFIINSNKKIKELMNGKKDGKIIKRGNRSEAEHSLITNLIMRGITTFNQIDRVMMSCKIGKWSEKTLKYREITFKKAKEFVEKNKLMKEQKAPLTNFLGINIKINPSTIIFTSSKKIVYEHTPKIFEHEFAFKRDFTLYQADIGVGNKPLILKTKHHITGEHIFCLEKMSKEKIKVLLWKVKKQALIHLCKLYGISATQKNIETGEIKLRETPDIIKDFLAKEDIFCTITTPIEQKELKKMGNPLEVCKAIFRENGKKDPRIDLASCEKVPEADPNTITPFEYQPYNPHDLKVTTTKTGKTSNALKRTTVNESTTSAGLIGFATADTRTYGEVHEKTEPTIIEEVMESKSDDLYGTLNTLMENGQANITKGIRFSTKTWTNFSFNANRKRRRKSNENLEKSEKTEKVEKIKLARDLSDFLTKLSHNTAAWGSRFGNILIDTKMKAAKGERIGGDFNKNARLVLQSYARGFAKEYSETIKNKRVQKWLNEAYNKEYLNRINELIKESVRINKDFITDFLQGHKESYRHAKGGALALAWLEVGISSLWEEGKPNIDKIIKSAEEHLKEKENINSNSLANMLSLVDSEIFDEVEKLELYNIKYDYVKYALHTLIEDTIEKKNNCEDTYIPFTTLSDTFTKIKEREIENKNQYYTSWGKVVKQIKKNEFRVNEIIHKFGIELDLSQNSFFVFDSVTFQKYILHYTHTQHTQHTQIPNIPIIPNTQKESDSE